MLDEDTLTTLLLVTILSTLIVIATTIVANLS